MAKKNYILLFVMLLVGCGSEQSMTSSQTTATAIANNHGYGFDYDEESDSGIRVRYFHPENPRIAELDEQFDRVMRCVLHYHPDYKKPGGPLIIFALLPRGDNDLSFGFGADGLTYLDNGTIVVEGTLVGKFNDYMRAVLRHELAHYILLKNGFAHEANAAHNSLVFDNNGKGEGCVLEFHSRLP